MSYATISDLARRWKVDRATARTVIDAANIPSSTVHSSPRYSWRDVLKAVEGWPEAVIEQIDTEASLSCAIDIAKQLGVTTQTVRNYGKASRLHAIRLSERAIRYAVSPSLQPVVRQIMLNREESEELAKSEAYTTV